MGAGAGVGCGPSVLARRDLVRRPQGALALLLELHSRVARDHLVAVGLAGPGAADGDRPGDRNAAGGGRGRRVTAGRRGAGEGRGAAVEGGAEAEVRG